MTRKPAPMMSKNWGHDWWTDEERAGLEAAKHLAENGVRLFLMDQCTKPKTGGVGVEWDPDGNHGVGYWPGKWRDEAKADPENLLRWRRGMGLGAVMGEVVDGVDVDPQKGGADSIKELGDVMPTAYGRQQTPSGGYHDVVGPLGVRSMDGFMPGVDVKAGIDGAGQGILFIAPTRKRSKTTGEIGTYAWETPPDLTDLALLGIDGTGGALAALVRKVHDVDSQEGWTGPAYDGPGYADLQDEERAEADRVRGRRVQGWRDRFHEALAWDEGVTDESGRGWRNLTLACASSLAMLTVCPWIDLDEDAAQELFLEIVPEEIRETEKVGIHEIDAPAFKRAASKPVAPPPWVEFAGPTAAEAFTDSEAPDAARLTGLLTRALARGGVRESGGTWEAKGSHAQDLTEDVLERFWTIKGGCTVLRTWLGQPYEWHQTHWEPIPPDHLEAVLSKILGRAKVRKKIGEEMRLVPLKPSVDLIRAVTTMVKWRTIVHARLGAGHWIDCETGRCPLGDERNRYRSFTNGILNLDTREWWTDHEPSFFNTYCMRFDYDGGAESPTWEKTLDDWFPGDCASQSTLEEMMGYLLLGDNRFQKIFVLLGQPRAGKGTVMRLLSTMVGAGFTTQSMDELGDRFGKEDLLGKIVCHVAEAVSTRDGRKVVSLVKSISGADGSMTVKRKGQASQSDVTFEVRFVFSGNEDFDLPDESGVIISRMIALEFAQSFLGRENADLDGQLAAESAGIFNRILAAYERLTERGRFIQPEAGEAVKQRLMRKASPERAWFADSYEVTGDPRDMVRLPDMVSSYQLGVDGAVRVSDRAVEMAISGLMPGEVGKIRRTIQGQKVRVLTGIRPREVPEDADAGDWTEEP